MQPATLGPKALRQIQKLVRQEMLVASRAPRTVEQIHAGTQGIYVAKSPAGGIAAITGGKAQSALCTVQQIEDDGTVSDALDSSGKTIQVRAWNVSAGAVEGDTIIQIKQELATGRLVVDFEQC